MKIVCAHLVHIVVRYVSVELMQRTRPPIAQYPEAVDRDIINGNNTDIIVDEFFVSMIIFVIYAKMHNNIILISFAIIIYLEIINDATM